MATWGCLKILCRRSPPIPLKAAAPRTHHHWKIIGFAVSSLWVLLVLPGLSHPEGPAFDKSVYETQVILTSLGYQVGPADGLWGPSTRKAVERFQGDVDIKVTGWPNTETLILLTSSLDEMMDLIKDLRLGIYPSFHESIDDLNRRSCCPRRHYLLALANLLEAMGLRGRYSVFWDDVSELTKVWESLESNKYDFLSLAEQQIDKTTTMNPDLRGSRFLSAAIRICQCLVEDDRYSYHVRDLESDIRDDLSATLSEGLIPSELVYRLLYLIDQRCLEDMRWDDLAIRLETDVQLLHIMVKVVPLLIPE